MEIVLLADEPSAAPKVARWYFDEWASAVPGMTLERVLEKVSKFVGRETAPLLVLAKDRGEVVGAAELKVREMDIYPDYEYWLGGVYVDEGQRGKDVASALVEEVLARARAAGIEKLYLQTEDLTGGLYRRHGFEPIEVVDYKGNRVLVMVAGTGLDSARRAGSAAAEDLTACRRAGSAAGDAAAACKRAGPPTAPDGTPTRSRQVCYSP